MPQSNPGRPAGRGQRSRSRGRPAVAIVRGRHPRAGRRRRLHDTARPPAATGPSAAFAGSMCCQTASPGIDKDQAVLVLRPTSSRPAVAGGTSARASTRRSPRRQSSTAASVPSRGRCTRAPCRMREPVHVDSNDNCQMTPPREHHDGRRRHLRHPTRRPADPSARAPAPEQEKPAQRSPAAPRSNGVLSAR